MIIYEGIADENGSFKYEDDSLTNNHDNVNHPNHYCKEGGIECIDAIESAVEGLRPFDAVCAGNAIKYVWRHNDKNGIEDLKKAIWYINKLIKSRQKHGDK